MEALGDLLAVSGRVWEAFGEALGSLLGGSGRPFGRLWEASWMLWVASGRHSVAETSKNTNVY